MRDRTKPHETPIAAFFDMDRTLLAVNSAKLWIEHLWRQGELSTADLLKSFGWLLGYKLALVDLRDVAADAARRVAGHSEEQMRARVRAWYEREIRPHIVPAMVEIVEQHRAQGHRLVLLTASSPYVAAPVADDVALHDYLCTRFEICDGAFTGKILSPLCYGAGKVRLSEAWAKRHGVDLTRSYFYTDSFTDLPMLERVGHPVAVNPDPRLARHARKHAIRILRTP